MALARLWNSLPMCSDFSNVVLLWSTSLAYRIWTHGGVNYKWAEPSRVGGWGRSHAWRSVGHLAVGVDPGVDEALQYELGELVLQGRYRSVEGLSHLGHVRRHVGAEILGGTGMFLVEEELDILHWTRQRTSR